jgi:hypothetical protein
MSRTVVHAISGRRGSLVRKLDPRVMAGRFARSRALIGADERDQFAARVGDAGRLWRRIASTANLRLR